MPKSYGIFRKSLPPFDSAEHGDAIANQMTSFIIDNDIRVFKDKNIGNQWLQNPHINILKDYCLDVVFGYFQLSFSNIKDRNYFLLAFGEWCYHSRLQG